MRLQDLPTEILDLCFKHLDNCWANHYLFNCRLTCRRFAELIVPSPYQGFSFDLSNTSLGILETLSQRPRVANYFEIIYIILSYYNPLAAQEIQLFAKSVADRIIDIFLDKPPQFHSKAELERIEENSGGWLKTAWEYREVGRGNWDISKATHRIKLLQEAHEKYQRLCHDQILAMKDGRYVILLLAAFRRLRKLHTFFIYDHSAKNMGKPSTFSDEELTSFCLRPSSWNQIQFYPGMVTPANLISDIFNAMELSSTHPTELELNFYAPGDLRLVKIPSNYLHIISRVLDKMKKLDVNVEVRNCYQLISSLDKNHNVLWSLSDLSNALCDVPALEELKLSFFVFATQDEEGPSAAQFLPLKTRRWAHLESLCTTGIPFHGEDIRTLTQQCDRNMLSYLDVSDVTLLSGSWKEAIEDLREFNQLQCVWFEDPQGAEFELTIPEEDHSEICREVQKYLCRECNENPLSKFAIAS